MLDKDIISFNISDILIVNIQQKLLHFITYKSILDKEKESMTTGFELFA